MSWLNVGLTANVGFEYRTTRAGYFYVGASYHRPFRAAYNSVLIYDWNNLSEEGALQLSGTYLTLDLKYFFHEPPEKKKKDKAEKKSLREWIGK